MKGRVAIKICESLNVSIDSKVSIDGYEVDIDSTTMCGGVTEIKGALKQKQRTKTEFVKCEYGDKVSNIVMDFENNVPLYELVNDEYWTIDELDDLFQLILNDCYIFRKVETEIDERQEFIDEAGKYRSLAEMFDSGRFKLVE